MLSLPQADEPMTVLIGGSEARAQEAFASRQTSASANRRRVFLFRLLRALDESLAVPLTTRYVALVCLRLGH